MPLTSEQFQALPGYLPVVCAMIREIKRSERVYALILRHAQDNLKLLKETGCCKHCKAYMCLKKTCPLLRQIKTCSPTKILDLFRQYEQQGLGKVLDWLIVNWSAMIKNDVMELVEQKKHTMSDEEYEHHKLVIATIVIIQKSYEEGEIFAE